MDGKGKMGKRWDMYLGKVMEEAGVERDRRRGVGGKKKRMQEIGKEEP